MSTIDAGEFKRNIHDWVMANRQPGVAVSELNDGTDLIASGALDSVGFVQLLGYAESMLGRQIDFANADTDDFTTLGGFTALALGHPSLSQQA